MKSNKGFSLVELIVVIAIMAIIAGVAIPVYTTYIKNAEDQVWTTAVEEVKYAVELECTLKGVTKPSYTENKSAGTLTITFGEAADGKLVMEGNGTSTGAQDVVADYFETGDKALKTADNGKTYVGTIK